MIRRVDAMMAEDSASGVSCQVTLQTLDMFWKDLVNCEWMISNVHLSKKVSLRFMPMTSGRISHTVEIARTIWVLICFV